MDSFCKLKHATSCGYFTGVQNCTGTIQKTLVVQLAAAQNIFHLGREITNCKMLP